MHRVHVANRRSEQVDIALHDGMGQAGALADGEFVEHAVLEIRFDGSIRCRSGLHHGWACQPTARGLVPSTIT